MMAYLSSWKCMSLSPCVKKHEEVDNVRDVNDMVRAHMSAFLNAEESFSSFFSTSKNDIVSFSVLNMLATEKTLCSLVVKFLGPKHAGHREDSLFTRS